jgi:hypothetical protein
MPIYFNKKNYSHKLQDYLSNTLEEFFSFKVVKDKVQALAGPKYKVYVATISQDGTGAPVATVLENTIGTVTWTRLGLGTYKATFPVELAATANRIAVYVNDFYSPTEGKIVINSTYNGANILTYNASNSVDGWLYNNTVELRVYE